MVIIFMLGGLMTIDPSEIDNIEEIGTLDDGKIKLIKTVGGLHLAVGKEKKDEQDKILGYSSHPAIVKHQLRKKFPMRFAESMSKSEGEPKEIAANYDSVLSKELRDSGYDVYALSKGAETNFVVTHHNLEILRAAADITGPSGVTFGDIQVKNTEKYKEFAQNDGKEALVNAVRKHVESTGK
jgi:hypothetical protein